ncbi:MAG: transketolase C-terminal domain-containing protein, partial [Patescibacteria group bacterium]
EKDPRVFLLGEGVDNIRGVYGHTLAAYEKFGPQRVIDTPLSENGLTGFAIGAALDGMRPVLIHQRNDFMLLAMDQMMNQAAKLKYASGGHHKIPLVILSFIARKAGEGVQHTHSLQSVFAHFPGIKVVMPSTSYSVKGAILAAIEDDDPVIVLEHCELLEQSSFVPEKYYAVPYKSITLFNVNALEEDVTIVAVSAAVNNALEARSELAKKNIFAAVIDLHSISPLDIDTIASSVDMTGRLVIVDTGWQMCGIGGEIIARLLEKNVHFLKPPKRINMAPTPCPASHYLLKHYHPDTESIVNAVMEMF